MKNTTRTLLFTVAVSAMALSFASNAAFADNERFSIQGISAPGTTQIGDISIPGTDNIVELDNLNEYLQDPQTGGFNQDGAVAVGTKFCCYVYGHEVTWRQAHRSVQGLPGGRQSTFLGYVVDSVTEFGKKEPGATKKFKVKNNDGALVDKIETPKEACQRRFEKYLRPFQNPGRWTPMQKYDVTVKAIECTAQVWEGRRDLRKANWPANVPKEIVKEIPTQ